MNEFLIRDSGNSGVVCIVHTDKDVDEITEIIDKVKEDLAWDVEDIVMALYEAGCEVNDSPQSLWF